MSWSSDLDMLAQAGVINFDAPSYIMGAKPRYVGNPTNPNPFAEYQEKPTFTQQPKVDEFKHEKNDGNIVDNPVWKKVLFGTLAIGGLVFFGIKGRKSLGKAWDAVKKACSNGWKSVKDFFTGKSTPTGKKGWWSNFKTKASQAWDATKKACSNGWDATKTFFSNGWKKFTGWFQKKTTP